MNLTDLNPEFEALLDYLRGTRNFNFTGYKRPSLTRRVQKRMQLVEVKTYSDYTDYLEVHPDEFAQLFNTILINVTAFFRDPAAWDYLSREIIPQIIEQQPKELIRVWSVGCASGEEAYTLAMVMAEALGIESFRDRVKIFATDVDEEALSHARQASYTSNEIAAVPHDLRDKYFEQVGSHYLFHRELRRLVIFGRHDLTQDSPISRINLLVSRNTLMYFNTDAQTQILERFHFALNNPGFLFLGKAEMLFTRTHLFTPVNLRTHVFAKVLQDRRDVLLAAQTDSGESINPRVDLLREVAFNAEPVAQVVISDGFLTLINDQARELFNLTSGDLSRPFQDLELSYRPVELRSHIEQVRQDLCPIDLKDVKWSGLGTPKFLEVRIIPLLDLSNSLIGIKVAFIDVTRYKQLREQLQHTHQELETAYEELQSTNEELETTNEELQSTVEELETTNEELQSTNEELETVNEEMQSTNEELGAINAELRQRSSELDQVNTFTASILASLSSGVVVVNRELRVMIWSRRAEDLWGLRTEEVRGGNFLNLDIGLPVEQLRQPIRDCLAGEFDNHKIVVDALNRRGRTIQCQVACTPLQSELGIQGVIMLMEELERPS